MSKKPCCELIDFVGNTGRHRLISAVDILGGKYSDDVIAAAKREIADHDSEPCDPEEELRRAKARIDEEEAKRAEAARRALIIGKATWTSAVNSPFNTLGIRIAERGWDKPATPDQHKLLAQAKLDVETLSSSQAQAMIGEIMRRRHKYLASVKMGAILKRNGFDENMSMTKAKQIMDILAKNRWRWPAGMEAPK